MIKLSKLNGEIFALNSDLIETITENPDTTLKLADGKYYIVNESMDEVIEEIIRYKKLIFHNSVIIEKDNYMVDQSLQELE
ncbi:MAG: flagellar FlbD family protein [Oscillospiraceae bacterium]